MRGLAVVVVALAACRGGGGGASHDAKVQVSGTRTTADAGAAPDAGTAPDAAPAAAPRVRIVDWPIAWDDHRSLLMLEYRRAHSDPDAQDITIAPRVIVLHFTGGGSARATHGYFDRTEIEAGRPALAKAGKVNVSSHFLVDRDGTIYRLQPETRMGRHCIGLNHVAIGIENAGDGKRWPLTPAQVDADVALIRDLEARFPIEKVIGHSESSSLIGTPYYVELMPGYRDDHDDPGAAFLRAVRAKLSEISSTTR